MSESNLNSYRKAPVLISITSLVSIPCLSTVISALDFGQVESDGVDSWKFYPVFFKDADNPEGGTDHTGIAGFAIRYDGP